MTYILNDNKIYSLTQLFDNNSNILLGVYTVGSFSWKFIGNNGKLALKCMNYVGKKFFYRFLCKWEHNEVLFSKKFERRRRTKI